MYCFITKEGKYIGMDQASGGYPYVTEKPLSIVLFYTIEDACKYRDMFLKEKWVIKKFLGLNLKDI